MDLDLRIADHPRDVPLSELVSRSVRPDVAERLIAGAVTVPATLHRRHEAASRNELVTAVQGANGRALALGLEMLSAAMAPASPATFIGNEKSNRPANAAARLLREVPHV